MKKILRLVLVLIFLPISVLATVNEFTEINLYIDEKGTGHFTTTYKYDDDQGTEHYIPLNLIEREDFSNYSVERNGIPMEYNPNWDISASLEHKADTYGLIETGDGVEMTFGISEYGKNTFVVRYSLENLILGLEDYNMLYHRFLNQDLSEKPEKIKLVVESYQPYIKDDVRMWSFGFDGEINLVDGKIVAQSSPDYRYDHMTILLRFPKDMYTASRIEDKKFDHYLEMALYGSDYDQDVALGHEKYADEHRLDHILTLIGALFSGVVVVIGIVLMSDSESKLQIPKDLVSKDYYFRDPQDMTIDKFYYILECAGVTSPEDYITGYFLKWIYNGYIEGFTRDVGVVLKKQSTNLRIIKKEVPYESNIEKILYNIVLSAAGSDSILSENELTKYIQKKPGEFKKFQNDLADNSRLSLTPKYIDRKFEKKFIRSKVVESLTPKGEQLTKELIGFKQFLEEFSLLNERESINVHLWDQYMIYAAVFGITEEVQKEFEKLYPKYIQETKINYNTIYWTNRMSRNMMRSYTSSQMSQSSSAGFGGRGSFGGGGGGFSGGGSGGGTR